MLKLVLQPSKYDFCFPKGDIPYLKVCEFT